MATNLDSSSRLMEGDVFSNEAGIQPKQAGRNSANTSRGHQCNHAQCALRLIAISSNFDGSTMFFCQDVCCSTQFRILDVNSPINLPFWGSVHVCSHFVVVALILCILCWFPRALVQSRVSVVFFSQLRMQFLDFRTGCRQGFLCN